MDCFYWFKVFVLQITEKPSTQNDFKKLAQVIGSPEIKQSQKISESVASNSLSLHFSQCTLLGNCLQFLLAFFMVAKWLQHCVISGTMLSSPHIIPVGFYTHFWSHLCGWEISMHRLALVPLELANLIDPPVDHSELKEGVHPLEHLIFMGEQEGIDKSRPCWEKKRE